MFKTLTNKGCCGISREHLTSSVSIELEVLKDGMGENLLRFFC